MTENRSESQESEDLVNEGEADAESGEGSEETGVDKETATESLKRAIEQAELSGRSEQDKISRDDAEIIRLMASSQRISGPLPSPEVLKAYQDLSPDIGQWILDSATEERKHRHWKEKEPLRIAKRGQTIAASIAFLVIGIGGFLLYEGRSTEGFVTMLVPLSVLLGVFVYQQIRTRNTELTSPANDPGSESTE